MSPAETNHRRALLVAALGFIQLDPGRHPTLSLLHRWLDTWDGIGRVAVGRATFYVAGMEHSVTSSTGSAFEPTAWRGGPRGPFEAASN